MPAKRGVSTALTAPSSGGSEMEKEVSFYEDAYCTAIAGSIIKYKVSHTFWFKRIVDALVRRL
jgi:hypothetical protein